MQYKCPFHMAPFESRFNHSRESCFGDLVLSCVVEKSYLRVYQTIDDEVDRAVQDYQEPVHRG